MSADEVRLAKLWHAMDNISPQEIGNRLERSKSTITRLLYARRPCKTRGRKTVIKEAQVDGLVAKLKAMIAAASGRYEVTVSMLKKSSRCKASLSTIRSKLHARGIYFYRMRTKPMLTKDDIRARFNFAKRYVDRPRSWWASHLHLIIDVKFFPIYLNGKARRHAAQTGTRGVYREAGQGICEGYYKPNPKLKFNTGAKGVHVLAGVGDGKVLLWEYIVGRWTAAEAVCIYEGSMLDALRAAYPSRSHYNVLEDNDPTGFRSKAGLAAKKSARIDTFEIPKRSPQLNLCDYWLWSEVRGEELGSCLICTRGIRFKHTLTAAFPE